MWMRWWTLLVWAAVALSAGYWALLLTSAPAPVPAQAQVAEPGGGLRGDLGRLLGHELPANVVAEAAPAAIADPRFTLLGVVSPRPAAAAREGLALIAVDGQRPRAYRVGAVIEGSHVLRSVHARGATLSLRDGPGEVALSIPPPAPAATGSLPPLMGGGGALPMAPAAYPRAPLVPPQTGFISPNRRQAAPVPEVETESDPPENQDSNTPLTQ